MKQSWRILVTLSHDSIKNWQCNHKLNKARHKHPHIQWGKLYIIQRVNPLRLGDRLGADWLNLGTHMSIFRYTVTSISFIFKFFCQYRYIIMAYFMDFLQNQVLSLAYYFWNKIVIGHTDRYNAFVIIGQPIPTLDRSHKPHNTPAIYLTIHHLEQKCAHFSLNWCIFGIWNKCIVRSVRLIYCNSFGADNGSYLSELCIFWLLENI